MEKLEELEVLMLNVEKIEVFIFKYREERGFPIQI